MSLLNVKDFQINDSKNNKEIVSNVNFTLEKNTCLGIVGESGSGKSMTVKGILGLTLPTFTVTGSVIFDKNIDLLNIKNNDLRQIRGQRICMILQDPMSSFNPLYTIGYQMVETLRENKGLSKKEAKEIAIKALDKMAIYEPEQVIKKYPHQLSGGMLQRCIIGLAMSMEPDIIIADEPTTALDSINQKEVIEEFKRLIDDKKISLIFISHDLGLVKYLAESVLVMKDGISVEYGKTKDIFNKPKHKYTKYLVDTRLELTKSFNEAMQIKEKVI